MNKEDMIVYAHFYLVKKRVVYNTRVDPDEYKSELWNWDEIDNIDKIVKDHTKKIGIDESDDYTILWIIDGNADTCGLVMLTDEAGAWLLNQEPHMIDQYKHTGLFHYQTEKIDKTKLTDTHCISIIDKAMEDTGFSYRCNQLLEEPLEVPSNKCKLDRDNRRKYIYVTDDGY